MNSRIYAAAVLGGIAILAITLVLVFQFGRHNPSPPSLADNPNPAIPGKILYVNDRQCVEVVEASGAGREEVYCFGRDTAFSTLYWVDGDTFAYVRQKSATPELIEVDIATGAESAPRPIPNQNFPGSGAVGPDGSEAYVEGDGVIVVVKNGVRTEVAKFDTHEYSQPQPVLWSPDGQWLLLQYYPPRGGGNELWIMSADGETRGTLVKNSIGWNHAWWVDGVGGWPELPK